MGLRGKKGEIRDGWMGFGRFGCAASRRQSSLGGDGSEWGKRVEDVETSSTADDGWF